MPTQNAAVVAIQLEKVRKNIPLWFQKDHGLYSLIKEKAGVEVVSSRALRVPIKTSLGGGISMQTMDGDDLGIGTSASYDVATLTPNYYVKAMSISKAAEYATNSDTKAVANATKAMITDATDALLVGLESLLNTDGSGTLGSVASVSGNAITLNDNANRFAVGQVIQVFPALGGTSRGNATVTGVSANSHTITVAAVPTGTAANDLLILAGAPGTAASALFGLEYVNSAATTGTYLGLSRTTYPILRSNHVSGGNAPLSVGMPRLLINQIRRTLGTAAGEGLVFHLGPDQSYAWEQLSTTVQRIDLVESKRDSTMDMLSESAPVTMAGRKIIESVYAQYGRVDALNLKTWGRSEVAPVDLLEFGGQTMFPQVGPSGGVASATLAYLACGMQTYADNPMANGYIDGLTVTAGS